MSSSEIQRFEKEILKGQVVPPDLRALLDVTGSAGDIDPLREALGCALLVPGRDYPLLTGSYLNDSDRQSTDRKAGYGRNVQPHARPQFVRGHAR